ncbi:hypothetical protein SLNWT_3371 [Streptomyces albus]|uniref:Uncharacterized protein n=1 Tax=Streptomyces albus (strain ATCC 21838 / DSM 41398 / FERM P-419 / JCM 4703 / NBRC 107858) TaxID=1081613 RepID=A0A0B5F096_STRA4|nr:hypothetical protein SLNWT_3371 [Streptomyces albus]AOU78053.1 hypothetical protein SLNHY_3362 [Streptomyces albus]
MRWCGVVRVARVGARVGRRARLGGAARCCRAGPAGRTGNELPCPTREFATGSRSSGA